MSPQKTSSNKEDEACIVALKRAAMSKAFRFVFIGPYVLQRKDVRIKSFPI